MDFALPLVGFCVGALIGMTGMGGGSLMTPVLVLIFGVPPAIAVGTDLLYAAITKCAGVWVHSRQRTIRWEIVGLLAAGSLPSAVLTVVFLRELGSMGVDYDHIISLVLSVALIMTSLVLVCQTRGLPLQTFQRFRPLTDYFQHHRKLWTVLAGLVVGVLVSLSSVGAGVLGAAMLLLLYPGLPIIAIAGTDLAYAIPLTTIAGLGHLSMGNVDFTLLAALLMGALPGTYLGSHYGSRLPDQVVRPILAFCLFAVGLKFAF